MRQQIKEPKVIKCKSTADLLASLPTLMGFHTPNSIVIALFNNNRAVSAIRCDLPGSDVPFGATGLDRHLVSILRKLKWVTAVAVAFYTSESFKQNNFVPRHLLAVWFQQKLETAGYEVKDFACVAADAWVAYSDIAHLKTGHALNLLEENIIGLESRTTLSEPLQEFSELGQPVTADLKGQESVEQHLETSIEIAKKLTLQDALSQTIRLTDSLFNQSSAESTNSVKNVNTAENINTAENTETVFPHQDLALLITLITFPPLWLASLNTLAYGPVKAQQVTKIPALTDSLNGRLLNEVTELSHKEIWDLKKTLQAFSMQRISVTKLRKIINGLVAVTEKTPPENRTELQILTAWALWSGGMSSPAQEVISQVDPAEKEKRLVSMVKNVINSGPPRWVFN